MICVFRTKSVNFNRFKLWLEKVVHLTRAVTLSGTFWFVTMALNLGSSDCYMLRTWPKKYLLSRNLKVFQYNSIFSCKFYLKMKINFSVYVGYDWIVHLYAHIIAASLPVLHDLTYLFHTKVPTPWNVGDTMQCCLLQKYGVIFTGRQSKAISLHSNFSTFWVESHFMGCMLTLSIQLKV